MAVSREEEVRQLAVRALRARLSGDVPTLEEIASRWLAYRVRAMMDDAAHTNPGERWHWANEPDHDGTKEEETGNVLMFKQLALLILLFLFLIANMRP